MRGIRRLDLTVACTDTRSLCHPLVSAVTRSRRVSSRSWFVPPLGPHRSPSSPSVGPERTPRAGRNSLPEYPRFALFRAGLRGRAESLLQPNRAGDESGRDLAWPCPVGRELNRVGSVSWAPTSREVTALGDGDCFWRRPLLTRSRRTRRERRTKTCFFFVFFPCY